MPEETVNLPEIPEIKEQKQEGRVAGPAFDLPIDDNDLADIIDKRLDEAERHNKTKLKLNERRNTNENFWLGKHFDESEFYEYQIPYKDNLIWQDLETRISLAASRMPDIIVTPADETKEKREHADTLEKGLSIKISDSTMRRLIKDGTRFHDLYLTAAIKCRWNRDINDYIFELVRPQKLVVDHTAIIPQDGFTSDNMEFIVEWVETSVAQVLALFPDKRDEILKQLGWVRGTVKQINSRMRYQEIWFTFYGNDGKLYEGIAWKLKKMILGKQRNPYFDWEGYEKDEDGIKKELYRNHFERPRKPYIFFTYQNLGKGPIDDTTPVEQAIPLQKIVNKRGRQITEIADRTVPKLIFSGDAITKEDARRTTNDPDEHILLNQNVQDVRAAVMTFQAAPPSPTLYQDLLINRTQIDAKFATHATTRGERVGQESGIARQIVREGDLSQQDDLSKIMIERVIYEMTNWAVQMMKLFYEKEHFVKDVGSDGEMVYVELKRDIIDDGISVHVKASSVDKSQRRFDAQTAAARRQIDPLSYWEDMDVSNPKERTRRLIAFLSGDFNNYYQITDLAIEDKDIGDKEAEIDIERLIENEEFEVPKPTPKYLSKMIEYASSEEYKKLSKTVKNRFKEFIKQLRTKFEETYLSETNEQIQSPELQTPQTVEQTPPTLPIGEETETL